MITKNILQDLIKSYDREGAWDKLESLYILAISVSSKARRNIEIKYGTDEPVKDVESDIERLCGEEDIPYQTDTDEICREVITEACEQTFPKMLSRKVADSISSLSSIAKRFVFLLYKEGTILNGKISRWDELVLSYFDPAYKIIFGGFDKGESEVHSDVIREMIRIGLIYETGHSSRRHSSQTFVVPPFAREVWLNLPKYVPFPVINVKDPW